MRNNRPTRSTVLLGSLAGVILTLHGVAASGQTSGSASKPVQPTPEEVDAINPDRPGIADGSAVVGRGRVQIESGVQLEFRRTDGTSERASFVPTLLRVGLSDHWEARVEGNTYTAVTTSTPARESDQASGLAPVSLGVKFHIQDSDGIRHPSLGTILRIFPASGTNGFGTNRTTGDVRLAADWDLSSRVSLNPNVGVAVDEGDGNRMFTAGLFALTLNVVNAAKTLNPFLDIGVQTPEAAGAGTSVIVDGGLAYLPGRNVQIDVSGGTGPRGLTPPRWFFSVGISLRLRSTNGRN